MKRKTIIIMLLLLCLNSCKAQEKNNKQKSNLKTHNIMYPAINKDFETFDNYRYEQLRQKDKFNTAEFLSNGNFFEMASVEAGKYTEEYFKDNYFNIIKHFYKNNIVKMKGIIVNNGNALIGTWYEFDEQGKLIKEVDYDKEFKFTFDDILKFCETEKISVDKGPILQSTGFHTRISRDHSSTNKESSWTIEWLKEPTTIQIIKLDGTTGKVLSRRDAEYINN